MFSAKPLTENNEFDEFEVVFSYWGITAKVNRKQSILEVAETAPVFGAREDRHQAYNTLRDEAPISFYPEVVTLLLKANPSLINYAIDESLRYASAVINFRRNALEDIEIRGQQIKADDKVVLYNKSTNFDERVFPDPEKFDITRDARKQVAFGTGDPHQWASILVAQKCRYFSNN